MDRYNSGPLEPRSYSACNKIYCPCHRGMICVSIGEGYSKICTNYDAHRKFKNHTRITNVILNDYTWEYNDTTIKQVIKRLKLIRFRIRAHIWEDKNCIWTRKISVITRQQHVRLHEFRNEDSWRPPALWRAVYCIGTRYMFPPPGVVRIRRYTNRHSTTRTLLT